MGAGRAGSTGARYLVRVRLGVGVGVGLRVGNRVRVRFGVGVSKLDWGALPGEG